MKYLVPILIVVAVAVYLNRAYSHFYSLEWLPPAANTESFITPDTGTSTLTLNYVALGDSLTAGVGAKNDFETYPYLFARYLANAKKTNIKLIDLGQPGAKSADVLDWQVKKAAEYNPNFVTLAIGINDMHNFVSADTFTNNVSKIMTSFASVKPWIINIPYLGSSLRALPPYRTLFDWQTQRYNSMLDVISKANNWQLIDLYSSTKSKAIKGGTYYSKDEFHPSSEGYAYWAKIIYASINH